MPRTLRASAFASGLLVLLALVASAEGSAEHFGLSRSAPEDGATVAGLEEVRMWFTQVPQEGSLSARVVDADGELVKTPAAKQDASDGKVFAVELTDGLPAGSYTVAWRGIGRDGHVVRGDFGFTVSGQ